MDPSMIMAIIAACAIFSPVATAIINNHYQLKIKKLEIEEQHEYERLCHLTDVREQVLMHLGSCLQSSTYENLTEYTKYYALAFQVFPASVHNILHELNKQVVACEWNSAMDEYESLAIQIAKLDLI